MSAVVQLPMICCPRCGGTGEIPSPREVGLRFREYRKGRGLSLREVARRAGVTPSYLSDLETGKRSWMGPACQRLRRVVWP